MTTTRHEGHLPAAAGEESLGSNSSAQDSQDTSSSSTTGTSMTRLSLPSFSSPVTDFTDASDRFECSAFGKHLPFLSRFLATTRQVDIRCHERQALVVFLMKRLEDAYYTYAHKQFPRHMEALQILSADDMELPVWKAFVFDLQPRFFRSMKRNEQVHQIRHIAVHRETYDTSFVKAAAIEAEVLGDDVLIKQIDIILRVLYADASPDSQYSVTQRQRRTVHKLLWPADRPVETMHQLLDKVQSLGETVSLEFCQRHLRQALLRWRCDPVATCKELTGWVRFIKDPAKWDSNDPQGQRFRDDILPKLEGVCLRDVRNAAAHRQWYDMTDPYEAEKLGSDIQDVINYVRILGDEGMATRIERLRATTLEFLHAKINEWMDPSWCDNRDWRLLYRYTEDRKVYWDRWTRRFSDDGVDVWPLVRLYFRSHKRLDTMIHQRGYELYPVRLLPLAVPVAAEQTRAVETEEEAREREEHARWWCEQFAADIAAQEALCASVAMELIDENELDEVKNHSGDQSGEEEDDDDDDDDDAPTGNQYLLTDAEQQEWSAAIEQSMLASPRTPDLENAPWLEMLPPNEDEVDEW
ncbi:MAG: hypothetical protein Q9210_005992 [Variospora velana]